MEDIAAGGAPNQPAFMTQGACPDIVGFLHKYR
jgi:hypothetical protein